MDLDPNEPNSFQAAAIEKIMAVLEKKEAGPKFQLDAGARKTFWTSFQFNGDEHILAIYEDNINMTQGPNLYESYMPEEFKSDEALIEGFTTRLQRYLSGGGWAGPREKGLPDVIKEKLGLLLGKRH